MANSNLQPLLTSPTELLSFFSFSFSLYSWTPWGVILARTQHAQLIPPAAHSLVLFGSTQALGVLTVYSSGEPKG